MAKRVRVNKLLRGLNITLDSFLNLFPQGTEVRTSTRVYLLEDDEIIVKKSEICKTEDLDIYALLEVRNSLNRAISDELSKIQNNV